MKRFLSIILSAVLLLSLFAFTSCNKNEPPVHVDDILGATPYQAYQNAKEYFGEGKNYRADVSLTFEVDFNYFNVPIKLPINYGDVYTYEYKDGNSHHLITDKGAKVISSDLVDTLELRSLFDGIDKESWYVEGAYYRETMDGERTVTRSDEAPITGSVMEDAVDSIVEDYIESALCYEANNEIYFEVVLTGEDALLDTFTREIYKVFIEEDGTISRIEFTGDAELARVSMIMRYYYDVDDITAPDNGLDFVEVE